MTEMFRYLVGVLEREEKGNLVRWGIVNGIGCLINILGFGITLYYINEIPGRYSLTGLLQESVELFIVFVILTEALFLLGSLLGLYQLKLSNRVTIFGAQKLSVRIYELFLKEDLEHHNQKSIAQTVEMIRSDTDSCVETITVCIGMWQNLAVLASYIIMLTYVYRWVGMLGGIVSAASIIGLFYWGLRKMKTYGARRRKYEIKTNAQITTTYGAFEETKIGNHSGFAVRKYMEASEAYAQAQNEFKVREGIISLFLAFSLRSVRYAIFALLIFFAGRSVSLLVPVATYIIALDKIVPVANGIVNGMGKVEFARKPYEELRKNLVRYAEMKEREAASGHARRKELTLQRGLTVRNLSFSYNEHTPIFEDAFLDIPVGSSVAVTGVSGAGKTTLLSLLLGFYQPQKGDICYDDYNIVTQSDGEGSCEANLGDLVSYIPQVVYMNGETVRRNVAFFEEDEKIEDERVTECLKCAQVWEDVRKMPEGIYTVIQDRGTTISGGQRQRIALARALYRDFELLIMDEATAALDMDMEKAVIDSVRQVKKNKTILLVTHHMSLADECDIVYRIENRKIVRVR